MLQRTRKVTTCADWEVAIVLYESQVLVFFLLNAISLPSHRRGCAVSTASYLETPIGDLPVNQARLYHM